MAQANRNVQRGMATREHLVDVATRLFAERGYEGTSTEAVLETAGVSRGSLYHHFKGKDALFEAVFEAVEDDVGERTVAAGEGAHDAFQALRAGCLAWVRMAGEPVVQRIVLIDAPSVLGWERWREIEQQHALGLITAILSTLAEGGRLTPDLVEVFAHVLLASMNEIALLIARADEPDAAMGRGAAAVDEVLSRLLRSQPSGVPPAGDGTDSGVRTDSP